MRNVTLVCSRVLSDACVRASNLKACMDSQLALLDPSTGQPLDLPPLLAQPNSGGEGGGRPRIASNRVIPPAEGQVQAGGQQASKQAFKPWLLAITLVVGGAATAAALLFRVQNQGWRFFMMMMLMMMINFHHHLSSSTTTSNTSSTGWRLCNVASQCYY
jgi:hypothetical protein